ncbi:hypothetical protein BGX28_005336 [Mortierella sp. GBA30]|nr:hypothetical protein BGX28_005336 [Mortierella sp. GBA30]
MSPCQSLSHTMNYERAFDIQESRLVATIRGHDRKTRHLFPIRPFSNPESSPWSFDFRFIQKLNVTSSPTNTPRRSLLSDLLNSQSTTQSRLEQNANRRRMLKSMRRYSVDASEMDFSLSRPSSRVTPMQGIPSEEEDVNASASTMLVNGSRQGFSSTPMVRYLRNPCHAAVKTKLLPSAYRATPAGRGGHADDADDEETPDYFGTADRVW